MSSAAAHTQSEGGERSLPIVPWMKAENEGGALT